MGRKKEKLANLEDRMLAYVESASDEDKNGRICHVLRAKTLNGPLALRLWDQRARDSFPRVGDFIEIRIGDLAGAKSELSNWWSLSLDSTSNKQVHCGWVPVNEEDVPEGVRKRIKRDRQAQKMKALEILKDESHWKDRGLHAFLMDFFKRNVEKFTNAPAALRNHHAYRGGLFIHTAHVFSLCHGAANHLMVGFDHIDSDVLYMAAWFHDVGKMEVYSMNGDETAIDSNRENMFGHITLGDRIFRREAEAAGLGSEFIEAVSHCILSHHQRRDQGAVVEPMTIEAHILCRADALSSDTPD